MQIYVVRTGDTIDGIAAAFGVSAASIAENNQIPYPYRLAVGQALLILEPQDRSGTGITGAYLLDVGGYAYPFINRWVLEQTLPYLSRLMIFSYGFTAEGELIPPVLDDTWMIVAARGYQVLPVLTLMPLGADGNFNNNLVSAIVRDQQAQQRLIWQLGRMMQEKGYGGVDIDFEYIIAEDRDGFTEFVQRTTTILNIYGYEVSVALSPKTSADQRGLLYEGLDYGRLGAAADHVLLMTYEWGYTYGPPMAVAPLNMVRRVVEYALTEIPKEKIFMGIPNYGYDWPLPYEEGATKARTLGNVEAVSLAIGYGVEIQFDEIAQSPYFRYWQYGIRHEVWFEDVRSIKAKFDLVKEKGMAGVGYWQVMQLFRANWLLLEQLFTIKKYP